jgi:putative membrane protein
MWHMNDVGWGWWLLMSVGMVAFWGLLIYGIVLLVRSAGSQLSPAPQLPDPPEQPQQMLKRRLAAGDIDLAEYERLSNVLDHGPATPPPTTAPH